jgi:hypothetical protein
MEAAYENIKECFENYFYDICRYQGGLKNIPRLKKFFAPDLELTMYTIPAPRPRRTMTRDELLMSFAHPAACRKI